MFDIRHQEQRISALKGRISTEREHAARQLRAIVPKTRKAALVGTLLWSARKALPVLQPLLLTLLRQRVGGAVGVRLTKALGIAALAFSLWRMIHPGDSNGS